MEEDARPDCTAAINTYHREHLRPLVICSRTSEIDWANAGVGALGEEPAARGLDELAFTEYLDGLRDAGWHENPQVVRLGYAAERALWYGLGGALDVQIAADESTHEWAEEVLGHSIQEMLERDASLVGFFLACAEEA